MHTHRWVIYPYKLGSHSARALAQSLGGIRVRPNGNYRVRDRDVIINWGSHHIPNWWGERAVNRTLNLPQYVENASDKIKAFEVLSDAGVACVPWTTDRRVAEGWLGNPRFGARVLNAVLCRTLTRANSVRGIVLAKRAEELVQAPLYTQYVPKSHEYRVHVHTGPFDVQMKKRVNGFVDAGNNKYIRNHPNGWVFCRENITVPEIVTELAGRAVIAMHLDFGAVDIGWHEEHGAVIYEVNTAPGLEGQTLTNYVNQFRRIPTH